MDKRAVLLINLGTPDNTKISSIRRYLREFLLDQRVIDLPKLFRYLLVYGVILPFRPYKIVRSYEKIWNENDSPLRTFMESLALSLNKKLSPTYKVVYAMRYGQPSISSGLSQLKDYHSIVVLPLFPQYSSAATGSAIAKTLQEISLYWNIGKITVIDYFYNDSGFIDSYSKLILPYLSDPETFLLLSYHGLPERHIYKSNCQASCNRETLCPDICDKNYFCYRAQCYKTSSLIAKKLALKSDQYTTSFQSRFGRIPWIKPYTDFVLENLRKKGVEKIAIACPAFVTDCLETLEEINMQARTQWEELGGKEFNTVPCLNDRTDWVDSVANIVVKNTRDLVT